ncbi:MAG: phosphoglucosamine mutase [Alteromonas naphthalenivorans]|jgi:phosphoglucosamine mutase
MQATLFGTDGIRTRVGEEPLTPKSLIQLGNALGHWMVQNKKQHVAFANDTRISCSLIKSALKTGLLQHNIQVTDAFVLPTPLLFDAVIGGSCDVGIMITASHNQYHDNGLKIFTQQGKTTIEQEQEISRLFYTTKPLISYEHLGTEFQDKNTVARFYEKKLFSMFTKNFLHKSTLVIDCANGAFSNIAPLILKSLGAKVITLSNKPTGKNINLNCGSQYPEKLQQEVINNNADIGFAFDGDGDRIIGVDKNGTVFDGDQILALLLHNPVYENQTQVVSTIMANQALETHLKIQNRILARTAVGDKNVVKYMQEHDCLVGGEPSGHIILRDFSDTSNGLFTMLRIVETLIHKKTWDVKTFTKYPQVLINVPIKLKKDLSLNPYANIINKHKNQLLDGRLVVRYSGTEPLLRVMIEDKTEAQAQAVGALLSQELAKTLAKEVQ